jgi:hypothetical protein
MPGAMPPPLMAPPPLMPAQPLPEYQYHLGVNGQQFGPYTATQIVQMVQAGQIAPAQTKVWRQGLASWSDLLQFPELALLLLSPAAATPPPLMPPPLV